MNIQLLETKKKKKKKKKIWPVCAKNCQSVIKFIYKNKTAKKITHIFAKAVWDFVTGSILSPGKLD